MMAGRYTVTMVYRLCEHGSKCIRSGRSKKTLDEKLDLLRLNSMRKYVTNTKHYICAHIYIDVNIQYIYANICNIFTAYVKVTTYLPTYVHYICDRC